MVGLRCALSCWEKCTRAISDRKENQPPVGHTKDRAKHLPLLLRSSHLVQRESQMGLRGPWASFPSSSDPLSCLACCQAPIPGFGPILEAGVHLSSGRSPWSVLPEPRASPGKTNLSLGFMPVTQGSAHRRSLKLCADNPDYKRNATRKALCASGLGWAGWWVFVKITKG